jgi:hypothetical protein
MDLLIVLLISIWIPINWGRKHDWWFPHSYVTPIICWALCGPMIYLIFLYPAFCLIRMYASVIFGFDLPQD